MNIIKINRIKKNLSQRELAEKIGCHKQQIHNFESGSAVIPLKYAKKLTRILKIDCDYLINEITGERIKRMLKNVV